MTVRCGTTYGTAADRRRLDESCSRTAFGPVLCHQGSLPVTKVSEDGLRDWQLPCSLASMVDGILLVELPHPVADRPGGLASGTASRSCRLRGSPASS